MSNNPPTKQPKKKIDIANTLTNKGSWLVMIMVMLFSMRHVTETSLSLEPAGTWDIWGWLLGGAVDTGLIITALRLRTNKENVVLWIGFLSFLAMTGFANINNALPHAGDGWAWVASNEYWMLGKVVLFAGIIPLLIWMMAEVNIGDKPTTESQPEPTTALATTTNHVANHPQQPTVNVAPPPQQPQQQPRRERQQHRLKRPQPALPTLPTMPVLQQPIANAVPENHQQPSQQPTTVANQQPIMGLPIPTTNLDDLLAQAVVVYQGVSSYDKAGARLNVSGEMVRKRVLAAWEQDPDWVAQILPAERLPK